jgi:hypothetical protein
MAQRRDVQEDDVGLRPSRSPRVTLPAPASAALAATAATRCVALFELFRGGAGPVQLGRLHDGRAAPRLVALRRLATLPTRELESAATRARGVSHPRLAQMLGTYQHEDSWYIASEYVSGVTLFELGQTAVRQRNPVSAPVAVRIVLDALRVTAEAAQLIEESTISARCLYPESLWIADSGELFVSELLVAPVLARTTTGASYVAVTAGMSAPASDVRAAAVELARLACGRLMNGNPASWHTRELPDELSELLARAVAGGPGTETPTAFAAALSALDPSLIAGREEVQAELERLMGAERLRRSEQLENLLAQTTDGGSGRVFRAAPAPAVPNFAKAQPSRHPPDLGTARRARQSTVPPPKRPLAPSHAANPTPTIPAPPLTPAPVVDSADSPISGVWREAHLKIGVPGRRARRKTNPGELESMTVAPAAVSLAVSASDLPVLAPLRATPKRLMLVAIVVVAVSAVLGAAWLSRSGSAGRAAATQHVP